MWTLPSDNKEFAVVVKRNAEARDRRPFKGWKKKGKWVRKRRAVVQAALGSKKRGRQALLGPGAGVSGGSSSLFKKKM